jgi:ankyrin repeat protein
MLRPRLFGGFSVSAIGALCLSAVLHATSSAPVADAAMQGDRNAVRSLLKQAADVNAAQDDGMTALHWAAIKGDVDLARMLMYAGANPKAATRISGHTPLLLASENGDVAMIETLVKGGADPNIPTNTGATPLMLAAASGNVDATKALLDHGANVNAVETAKGHTALMFAAASNRVEVLKLLLQRGADHHLATKVVHVGEMKSPNEEAQERERREALAAASKARAERERKGEGAAPAAAGQREENNAAEGRQAAAKPGGAPPEGKPVENIPAASQSSANQGAPGSATEDKSADNRPADQKPDIPGITRPYRYSELIGWQGGLTALHFAARQGYLDAVKALLEGGADVNEANPGDKTTALLVATINGNYDVARFLLDHGADPNLAADNGATPLYAVLNCQWAPKSLYPQPRAFLQQTTSYLDLMSALLENGADPNARLRRKVWYSGYNFDLSGVDEAGATPFWRAAYAADVDAMRLLVAHGADPNIPTTKPAARPRTGDGTRDAKDVSGLPPIPVGGPGVSPLQAAAGVGYGEGFAANSHRYAPGGQLAAVKYLVEELHADVNSKDHEGNTALHHAASRGDVPMIEYLVSKGADVKVVNREGKTTADMANGPVQRVQPWPEALALLEKLGAKNNHKCVSC